MPDRRTLARACTTLSECPQVTTDGMTAWVVGVPAPEADGVGPDEGAVSLPLDLLLQAADTYRGPARRRWESDDVVGVLAALAILVLGIGAFVVMWKAA